MLLRILILLFITILASCDEGVSSDSQVEDTSVIHMDVVDPESVIGTPPKGVPHYDNERLIRISGLEEVLRYGRDKLVIVSNSKEAEVYENVIYLKQKAAKVYDESDLELTEKFIKLDSSDEITKSWYYINQNSFNANGKVVACLESFGSTEVERVEDSSCFIRGKEADYYYSYNIYHNDEYLKHGDTIHAIIMSQLPKSMGSE